ncbi:MAG: YihY family inner membrane protein [Herminiimonas sp.]|nr:YihY family inner membrane protein [Herminiimonas sp.]
MVFPRLRSLSLQQIRDLVRFAARRLNEERLPQVAGSLTFTTVLGLVPLLTIALAIFTAFPLFNTFRASLETYFSDHLMPQVIATTTRDYLNQFASKSMRLSAVGAIALVFTAVTMMSMIDRVFNRIWRVTTPRPFVQRILVYWALVTLGPLLIGVSITLTSYLFSATNDAVMHVPFIGGFFYSLISLLLTTVAFALLYATVPNRAISWRDAAAGGLLAGIAFEIAKRLFAIYITKFPTYMMVYGSIAAIPIFLLWIYMFWLITLIGALFAAALPIVKYERWWHVPKPGSAFVDAVAILKVLYDARSSRGSAAVDANRIRNRTRVGFDESEALLGQMLDAGWVGRIKTDPPKWRSHFGRRTRTGMDRWTLLANPQQLKLAEVYRRFVFNGGEDQLVSQRVEQAVEQGLTQSLAAYFASESSGLDNSAHPSVGPRQ